MGKKRGSAKKKTGTSSSSKEESSTIQGPAALEMLDSASGYIKTLRQNWEDIEKKVQGMERRTLHYVLRKIMAGANFSEEPSAFGQRINGTQLVMFDEVLKAINVDDDALFDAFRGRTAFLACLRGVVEAEEKNQLQRAIQKEAKVMRRLATALKNDAGAPEDAGEVSKMLDEDREMGVVVVLISLNSILSEAVFDLVETAEPLPAGMLKADRAFLEGTARQRCPPDFSTNTRRSDETSQKYQAASEQWAQIELGNMDVADMALTYKAYMFNPHLTYLLSKRTHPLLSADVAQVACQGSGTIAEAFREAPTHERKWTSDLAASRLIAILDAPCTTEDCSFHSMIMYLGEYAKQQGNNAFRKGDIPTALENYGRAVGLVHWDWTPNKAIYLSNAAQCLLKLEQYEAAVRACSSALEIDSNSFKSWQRRSMAHEKLGDIPAAVRDAQRALATAAGLQLNAKEKQKNEARLMELRRQMSPDSACEALSRLSQLQGLHGEFALAQGKSLIKALVQQFNGAMDQDLRACLAVDLATALKMYSTALTQQAFPGLECNDCNEDSLCLSGFQYEAAVAILENIKSLLLLTPDDVEAQILRVQVAFHVGELDICQNDILALKDRGSSGQDQKVREIEAKLKSRTKQINQDLNSKAYCTTDLKDNNEAPRLHGGKYRHGLKAKKIRKVIDIDEDRVFRDARQIQEEMIESRMVPTFRDFSWCSESSLRTLQEKWNRLDADQQLCLTSLSDSSSLDGIVQRLAPFGDGRYDHRGPYAASQARVDRESLLTTQFLHEAWARTMSGDSNTSFSLAVERSTAPEIVPRLAKGRACIPLSQVSLCGPALACGLESWAINDSASASWRLDRCLERSSPLWLPQQSMEVVDSSGGVSAVSVMAQCSKCRQQLRIHAYPRVTLRMVHDEKESLVCRDCASGIRHFRGMGHLRRNDLHEKALAAAVLASFQGRREDAEEECSKQSFLISRQQEHVLMSRLDWMTAAFDLIEDRILGEAPVPDAGAGRRVLNATSNVIAAGEEDEEDPYEEHRENEEEDEHLRMLKEASVKAMLSLNLFDHLDGVGDLDKNANVCANCGKDEAPHKCNGCRALRFCSQNCLSKQWKKSHKNCCMPAEIVADIFARLVSTDETLTLTESKTLATTISGPLTESERHRLKLVKAHPQGASQIASLFQRVEKTRRNLSYLNCLSEILLAICSHRAGRRGMGIDGLFGLQQALVEGDLSNPDVYQIRLAKVFRLMDRSDTRMSSPSR